MDRQKELGALIKALNVNYGKDGPLRKTTSYKKKKLKELLKLWNEYDINDVTIKLAGPNAEYDKKYEEVEKIFNDLKKKLEAIPDESDDDTSSDDNLELELKKQHNRFKALEKSINEIEQGLANGDELSVAYSRMKFKKMDELWERIAVTHEEITTEEDKIKDGYFERYETIEKMVECNQIILQEAVAVRPITAGQNQQGEGVKLQRLSISKFFGDYAKWVTFRDLFNGMVVENKSYTDAQRLQILKSNVGGEAEGLINDLTISDANFTDAWDRLMERFNDNKTLVYRSINKLLVQSTIKGDAKSLKTLLDTTHQTLLTLKNIGRPTDKWDDWIIVITTQKLNDETRKDWGKVTSTSKELPTWVQLKQFLEEQFKMLEDMEMTPKKNMFNNGLNKVKSYQATVEQGACPVCQEGHQLWNCDKFKKMEVRKRWDMVKNKKLCFKCLAMDHDKLSCERDKPCKKCDKEHSTWLHDDKKRSRKYQVNVATKSTEQSERGKEISSNVGIINNMTMDEELITVAHTTVNREQVLLATAVISTNDIFGRRIYLRALMDSGSQGSMMTEEAATLLHMKPVLTNNEINGLGGGKGLPAKSLTISIQPHFGGNFDCDVECYVLRKLTRHLPDHDLNFENWNHIKDLQWADPKFYKVGPIDVLLGAEVTAQVMKSGLRKGNTGEPMAQQTELGWIIFGKINAHHRSELRCYVSTKQENDIQLE